MAKHSFARFSRSIIFKVLTSLIVSMSLVVIGSTLFFNSKQTDSLREWNGYNNEAQLKQIAVMARSEMEQFGDRLTLLSKTSELQSMDPAIAASFLKSYNVSTLFISGETIAVFDKDDHFVCDNSMIGQVLDTSYQINFSKVTPHRPLIMPWYRESSDATPKRLFGINVTNRAIGDGTLVASFSIRRLWHNFSDYKIGRSGFLVAINGSGEVLYHPDLKRWLSASHNFSELGFENADPRTMTFAEKAFVKLSDGNTYLVSYVFDSTYDLGIFALQPKAEIDEQVNTANQSNLAILVVSVVIIIILAGWMFLILGIPLNTLIQHINQISKHNLEIEELNMGSRKDEIGQLSKAFNLMHRTIKRQIDELNAHKLSLEQEVSERTHELEIANKKLDKISKTDELTGLPNRRDMNETIAHEVERTKRTHKPFCFIFIDIDHFKNINDTYGHACGDVVLKAVAQKIRGLLRKYDVFARYGGEEFLTLLPETDLEGAAVVAERFRKRIENMTIRYADYAINVTITLGVALFDHKLGASRSIQMADKALYQGKESGRNRIVVWQPEWTTEADYEAAAIEIAVQQKDAAEAQKKMTQELHKITVVDSAES